MTSNQHVENLLGSTKDPSFCLFLLFEKNETKRLWILLKLNLILQPGLDYYNFTFGLQVYMKQT